MNIVQKHTLIVFLLVFFYTESFKNVKGQD